MVCWPIRRARQVTATVPAMEYALRPAGPHDEPFLTEMLALVANWRGASDAGPLTPRELHCVEGFGRPGDIGVIAERAGEPAGAAWCRVLTGDDSGYGYVADDVPELAIGVSPRTAVVVWGRR